MWGIVVSSSSSKNCDVSLLFLPNGGLFQAPSYSRLQYRRCLRWLQPHIDFIGSAAALTYLTIFWPLKHALSSCAPVRPAQKMKRVKHLPETEDFSITSAVKDTKKEKISDNELPDSIRGLISLDSNTVRYLNKRKPSDKTNSAYTLHASRANVVSIFKYDKGIICHSFSCTSAQWMPIWILELNP